MVEMGTFVAILLGSVAGGLLIAMPAVGAQLRRLGLLGVAVLGRAHGASRCRASPSTDPGLRINWNPVSETWRNLKLAHGNLVVFRSLLGISWMWFFGAVFLSQFPAFAKEVLHGDEQVASLLLVVFSVGIGIGSLLCEVLSRRHVEIGLVPLGAIGMSVFAIDLYFASRGLPPSAALHAGAASSPSRAHWRVMADLCLLSLFAGLYSVPMYALIQLRSAPSHRARIIAANNILNALFMIASSVIVGVLLTAGLTIPQVFLVVGIAERGGRVLHLHAGARVPAALRRLRRGAPGLPLQGARRRAHPDRGRGDPGLQPRQLRRRGAADGGQPAADPLHHGPPDLQGAGAGLVVPARQGDPDRAAEGGRRDLRAGLRARPRGARRRRPGLHLPRRRRSRATASCGSSRAA